MQNAKKTLKRKKDNIFIKILKYFFPHKGCGISEGVRKIMFLASIGVFVFLSGELSSNIKTAKEEKRNLEDIRQYAPPSTPAKPKTEETNSDQRILQEWAKPLLKKNEDLVGWITIPNFADDTGSLYVDEPVVQGYDNNEYLRLNFDKEYFYSGSIYADCHAVIDDEKQPQNMVIYGHNVRNLGIKFTHLTEYKSGADFLRKYPIVEFNTIYEHNQKYIIFGAFVSTVYHEQDNGNLFQYNNYLNFDDTECQFSEWINEIQKRNWYDSDIELTENDQYLTLSTCTNEAKDLRWVIMAKKLTDKDDVEAIKKSYVMKPDSDIYFPDEWIEKWGNHPVWMGWAY